MNRGFAGPLYLLPFDHRFSYVCGLFDFEFPLTAHQHEMVSASKEIIYNGFRQAQLHGMPAGTGGILVDEQFGVGILRDANKRGTITALPVEQGGAEEFEFEYGADFASHITAFNPTFAKVQVRYNPYADLALNKRQAGRLACLSRYCQDNGPYLMVELRVPATALQLAQAGGSVPDYERKLRPTVMCEAIRQLQREGIEPDVWSVEGLSRRDDCERIVTAARHDGRDGVGCIVLGGGADEAHVRRRLTTAAGVDGFIGFAVGRTTFWDALVDWRNDLLTRTQATARIAARFSDWVEIFEQAHPRAGSPAATGPTP